MCSPCEVLTVVWTTALLCTQPPELSNGSYSGPVTAYPGTLYDYSCDAGLTPIGDNAANLQAECLDDGKYSLTADQLPICADVCTNPSTIEYGDYNESFTGSYVFQGKKVDFYCDEGYFKYPVDGVLECDKAEWSAEARCLGECPALPETAFASHNVTEAVYEGRLLAGTEITYICDDSHHFKMGSIKTITCESKGNWSLEALPECSPLCEVAPEIANGFITMVNNITLDNGTVVENIMEYSCNSGFAFLPSANTTLECHPGAQWVPEDAPVCYGVCTNLPTFEDGDYNESFTGSHFHGENVNFYCNEGYLKYPVDGALECGEGGWNAEAICLGECPVPVDSYFSSWSAATVSMLGEGVYATGSEITYTCDEEHPSKVWTSMNITCDSRGNWSLEAVPECVPLCIATPEIANGDKTVLSDVTLANGTVAEGQVEYSCMPDYSFLPSQNATLECHPGMLWVPDDTPVCYKICPTLLATDAMSLEMTTVVSGATLLYGTTYDITCDANHIYSDHHLTTTECEADGNWSNSLPTCERDCGVSVNVTNGNKTVVSSVTVSTEMGVRQLEHNVSYSCDDGYAMVPESAEYLICGTDGSFEATPECLAICPTLLATDAMSLEMTIVVSGAKLLYGTTYDITCDANYVYSDHHLTTTECEADGNWSNSLPTCERDCGVSVNVTNGNKTVVSSVTVSTEMGVRQLDHNVSYSCDDGYAMVPESAEYLICGTDGSFEAPPECLAICPTLLATDAMSLEMTTVVSGAKLLYGTTYDITCDANHVYSDHHLTTTECEADGNWSNSLPTCERDCGVSVNVTNGNKTVVSSVTISTEIGVRQLEHSVSYSCDDGYAMVPESAEYLICGTDGSFEVAPECLAICPTLLATDAMSLEMTTVVSGAKLLYGTTYDITCDANHIYSDHHHSTTECEADGNWSNSLPTCERDCGVSVNVTNGDKTVVSSVNVSTEMGVRQLEHSVSYSCDDGYAMVPESAEYLICGTDGSFEAPPECLAKCPTPSYHQNPHFHISSFSITHDVYNSTYVYGTQVTYFCSENYVYAPVGEDMTTCGIDGTWSEILGTCHLECPSLVSEGRNLTTTNEVFAGTRVAGTVLEMTCDEHYAISNHLLPLTTECGSDGNWIGSLPTCERDCGTTDEIVNGTKTVDNDVDVTFEGGVRTLELDVSYSCSSPLSLVPSTSIQCGLSGAFEPPYSFCAIVCPFPDTTAQSIVVVTTADPYPGDFLPGTVIEYQCEEYYTMSPSADVIASCGADGTWNMTIAPDCELEVSGDRTCSVDYTFFVTNETGTWDDGRAICQAAGGDLMHENFGFEPHGNKFFKAVKDITLFPTRLDHIYVGVTNRDRDDIWRFLDGTVYNNTLPGYDQLFQWANTEPNNWNGFEWCLEITAYHQVNDEDCTKTKNHALCEIKEITCIDN